MDKKPNQPFDWYNLAQADVSYTYAVCRWGAGLAATSKAIAGLFERMAAFQVDCTRDMARLTKDPTSAPESYAACMSRLVEMQGELQGAIEKLTREADLMYESIRRDVEGNRNTAHDALGDSFVDPSIKYGGPESALADGPADWQFEGNSNSLAPTPQPRVAAHSNVPTGDFAAPEETGATPSEPLSAANKPEIAEVESPKIIRQTPYNRPPRTHEIHNIPISDPKASGYRRVARAKL